MDNDNITLSTNELSRLDSPSYNNNDTIYIYDIPIKRYLLPLVGCVGFLAFDELHTYVYMPLVIFLSSLILFWNFPEIIIFMNSKPLYYEELFLVPSNIAEIGSDVREKFEYIFDYSLLFTNALFTAGLADYWLYQSWNTGSYIEIVGVTGGILKIFQSINFITGGIILYAVRFRIELEIELNNSTTEINIELDTISHNLEEINFDSNITNNSNIIFSMPTTTEIQDDIIIIHSNADNNQTIFVHMANKTN